MSLITGKIIFYKCYRCGKRTEPLIGGEFEVIPIPDDWTQASTGKGSWEEYYYQPSPTVEYCGTCSLTRKFDKND
jgi:hypothetical protein